MNTKKKIEQYLKAAPKPAAPDGLLDRLQADVSAQDIKTHRSALRRWFAPAGERISFRRVAAAAVIAIAVLLPLSYGATKVVRKYFITFEAKFEYPEDGTVYRTIQTAVVAGDNIKSEEDAKKVFKKALEEFGRLYRKGKAKEVRPGVWQAILSNGEKFNYGGNPESLGVSEMELKKQLDEIHELKKAGKYEKTYKPEHDYVVDGAVHGYGVRSGIGSNDPDFTEEDARKAQREFYELYKQGKAEEIEPGFWFAILSNGRGFGARDPEMLGLSDAERKEFLKKQFDEIEELRKAGKFEKIYKPEHDFEIDGVKYRYYLARYALSDGTVKTVGSSEPVKDEDQEQN